VILANVPVPIRLFGQRFTNDTIVRFTTEVGEKAQDCNDLPSSKDYAVSLENHKTLGLIRIVLKFFHGFPIP